MTVDWLKEDLRGSSEARWLELVEFFVGRLTEATGSHLHVGEYWCSDHPGYSSVGIHVRLRSRQPLPFVKSDYWDGSLSYSWQADWSGVSAHAYPFLNGERVYETQDWTEDEYRWLRFESGQFVDAGWSRPECGPELEEIPQPGDFYWDRLQATPDSDAFQVDQPITIQLTHNQQFRASGIGDNPRVTLIHANRGRERFNAFPWGEKLPRPDSKHSVALQCEDQHHALVDLQQFNIRGGWSPGRYHVALRVQNWCPADDWTYTSYVSPPFSVRVID